MFPCHPSCLRPSMETHHEPFHNAKSLMDDLGEGGQAVGSAGCIAEMTRACRPPCDVNHGVVPPHLLPTLVVYTHTALWGRTGRGWEEPVEEDWCEDGTRGACQWGGGAPSLPRRCVPLGREPFMPMFHRWACMTSRMQLPIT